MPLSNKAKKIMSSIVKPRGNVPQTPKSPQRAKSQPVRPQTNLTRQQRALTRLV